MWFSLPAGMLPHPPEGVSAASPSPGRPARQGGAPWCGASLQKGCQRLLRKIAFILQVLLLLVWPWLSVGDEILSKVWRKLNTFLGSEVEI